MKNIYLAGLPRGGTTLISCILGQHSMIKQMGESMYSGVLDPNIVFCSCGEKPCPVWLKINDEILKYPKIVQINRVYGIIDKLREPNKVPHNLTIQHDNHSANFVDLSILVAEVHYGFNSLVKVFKKVLGNYIFVNNTKEIIFSEQLVKDADWVVLLITRDPRGMAWSSVKSGIRKNVPRTVFSKIPVYLDFAERAVRLKNNFNVFHLKYEDLCDDPIGSIKKVCDFLGLDYENEMLKFKKDKGHVLTGNRMMYTESENIIEDLSWKNNLLIEELNLINKNSKLTALYSKLGYTLG